MVKREIQERPDSQTVRQLRNAARAAHRQYEIELIRLGEIVLQDISISASDIECARQAGDIQNAIIECEILVREIERRW